MWIVMVQVCLPSVLLAFRSWAGPPRGAAAPVVERFVALETGSFVRPPDLWVPFDDALRDFVGQACSRNG